MLEEMGQQQQQEQSPPPSKVARLFNAEVATMASPHPPPPTVVLGLGLGIGSDGGAGNGTKSAFTFLQLRELEHQALIYKYMVAGVPVPFHLVLPIWKSVAGSSSSSSSFMGCGSGLCFDYRNSMEPEPGRCRRTDGKKWRCSKDVVPNQKYCERHMHRGRHRSRKPVEGGGGGGGGGDGGGGVASAPPPAAAAATAPVNHSISIPTGFQLVPTATPNTSNSSTISLPTRLGFSPTSVLQNGTCKTEFS